jgi:hypothetical protein
VLSLVGEDDHFRVVAVGPGMLFERNHRLFLNVIDGLGVFLGCVAYDKVRLIMQLEDKATFGSLRSHILGYIRFQRFITSSISSI